MPGPLFGVVGYAFGFQVVEGEGLFQFDNFPVYFQPFFYCLPNNTTATESERIKALERENRELKRANEILRLASAFFAQAELDRKPKL